MFSTNASQVSTAANYIEDVFSTYLYAGNSSTQTITNGIDLSTKGGLVWTKIRNERNSYGLIDTTRGALNNISSNSTSAQSSVADSITAFNSSGYELGGAASWNAGSPYTFVSWTFRKQPKFFDVVTYTGNGSVQNIAHNLGSVPGCMIVKRTDAAQTWPVYHRSLATNERLILETTAVTDTSATTWNNTAPTSTVFTVGGNAASNASGGTYVAYLFAHNAGGFGLTGNDNVISCGSFTTNGSGNVSQVSLGYEPQWVLYKTTDVADNWRLVDSMRGMPVTAPTGEPVLKPNLSSAAEQADAGVVVPNATGFSINGGSPSFTYIYIAIRRGPMKVPTVGTTVFAPIAYTGSGAAGQSITTGFVSDMVWWKKRSSATNWRSATLLAGINRGVSQNLTAAEEVNPPYYISSYQNTGFTYGDSDTSYNASGQTYIADGFSRAPGFFDVVCYTSDGTYAVQNHNLGVVPQLVILKQRNDIGNWNAYTGTQLGYLELTDAFFSFPRTLTSTTFQPASTASGGTFVAYLFATCAGVSKVGSYTGTGATQTIDCGFTGGARFVLIKRTDSTGAWYVWDTARGMVAGTDPSLLLNSTAAEVNANSIYTTGVGFQIVSTAAGINASGGTYIFLAIA